LCGKRVRSLIYKPQEANIILCVYRDLLRKTVGCEKDYVSQRTLLRNWITKKYEKFGLRQERKQVDPVGALYVQSLPVNRKLKTNYRNFKIMFQFHLLPYVFTENET